ncbi:DUF1847 domain-containing protein [Dethiosulfatarculus sandiegensis]|uniref:Metal-binding protein n=1 Tax=Dethiosulfatarculus sandiegensis TaxID=1429043 RepID=A0A0D2HW08_9BACT|nr:DUF1847 domain-containing protein [Dethiosulfatarculus sandiegensis]KIX14553.1 hypothetical protein X474_08125 [Dethiosulfatarculus sandiegensis]
MSSDKKEHLPSCAAFAYENPNKICVSENGTPAKGCPTLTKKKVLAEANKEYEDPGIKEFAHQASAQEASAYANRGQSDYVLQPAKTRIQEICEFAHRMGYKRLGMAFCVGLAKEAMAVEEIFKIHGFEVASVCCKAGRTPKEVLDLKVDETIRYNTEESLCNPIFQAKALNDSKTEFNVLLGLCVGHDSLFFKYAEAPVTVLAAKDRVTGHNPLAPIYQTNSYYQKLKHPEVLK